MLVAWRGRRGGRSVTRIGGVGAWIGADGGGQERRASARARLYEMRVSGGDGRKGGGGNSYPTRPPPAPSSSL